MNFSAASNCQRVCSLGQRLLALQSCFAEPILDIIPGQTRALFCSGEAPADSALTLRHRCVITPVVLAKSKELIKDEPALRFLGSGV